jgi:uncharacterized protein (TIGR04255 family)
VSELPDFERPPVIEVACGVQFRSIEGLRGPTLAPLYNQWRGQLPRVQEQPPLAPLVDASAVGAPSVQLYFADSTNVRYWFSDAAGHDLVQFQQDRLIVNWRESEPPVGYPRFSSVRENLSSRLADLSDFLAREDLGGLEISHAEVSYINAIEVSDGDLGALGDTVRGWPGFPGHHLGKPAVARAVFEFPIPDVGQGARLVVTLGPGGRANGEIALFVTMTVQGRTDGASAGAALAFVDAAHGHLVRSFAEITTESQHTHWGRRS